MSSKSDKKKSLVPRLRFPEFREAGAWEVKRLGELASRITGRVGSKKLIPISISSGVGFVSQAEKFGRDISGKQYEKYIALERGQFSYNKGNSKTFPQGSIYQLQEFEDAAVPNAFYSFEFKKKYVPEFYNGYFEKNFHGHQLARFITSGARSDGLLNISAADFFSIVLPTPTNRDEQQKIAHCLSSLDEVIGLQAKKVQALKQHKKGLMQQLFPAEGETTTPRLRFPEFREAGAWEVKRLGGICNVLQGYGFPERLQGRQGGKYPFCKVSDITSAVNENGGHVVTAANYADEDIVAELRAKPIPVGATIFAKIGEALRLNKRAIVDVECLVDNNVTGLKAKASAAVDYFIFLLSQNVDLNKHCGGAVPSVNKSTMEAIKVLVPEPPEQQKIAHCLSSLDEVIGLESHKLDALKNLKKGLMQQLFPQDVA